MTDPTLQRFHEALVEALRERGPADLARPFTVAEIYQDLVPYRTHRDRLGVEMNADYEHALLRLLAGEGGYLEVESEHALREIRRELEEVDPDTTLYREFAAVDVRLAADEIAGEAGLDEASPEEIDPVPLGATPSSDAAFTEPTPQGAAFTEPTPKGAAFAESTPQGVSPVEGQAESTAGAKDTPRSVRPGDGACGWCRSELPERPELRYCPYCGEDQSTSPCRSCGAAMEGGWHFCIACGAEVVG